MLKKMEKWPIGRRKLVTIWRGQEGPQKRNLEDGPRGGKGGEAGDKKGGRKEESRWEQYKESSNMLKRLNGFKRLSSLRFGALNH